MKGAGYLPNGKPGIRRAAAAPIIRSLTTPRRSWIAAAACGSLEGHLPLHAGQRVQEGDQVGRLLLSQSQRFE